MAAPRWLETCYTDMCVENLFSDFDVGRPFLSKSVYHSCAPTDSFAGVSTEVNNISRSADQTH